MNLRTILAIFGQSVTRPVAATDDGICTPTLVTTPFGVALTCTVCGRDVYRTWPVAHTHHPTCHVCETSDE